MASTLPSLGKADSPSPVPALSRYQRALIASCVVLITGLAWAYLVHLNRHMTSPIEGDAMMAAMGKVMNQAWGAGDLLLTFVMWAVMMVGMMAAPALPVLLLFAGIHAQRGRGLTPAVPSFGIGYLVVWLAFSAGATAAQWALHEGALLSPMLATTSTFVAGVILISAGAYQLTPLKSRCLARCQSPLGFLMSNWRDGVTGAFLMGFRHGIFCLGCCWALMAVLFVVGVMNLAWVGVLTLFILAEKIRPTGAQVSRASGAILIALGLALALGCRSDNLVTANGAPARSVFQAVVTFQHTGQSAAVQDTIDVQ
jgi:predicted metal-binding membrane protein